MAKVSFREALEGVGEPGGDAKWPRWAGEFHCSPSRLSQAIRMLAPSRVSQWTRPNEWEFSNEDWTEECQGVTSDGNHWYLCSNKCGWGAEPQRRAIYKFDASMNLIATFELGVFLEAHFGNLACEGVHVGDIDWRDGFIHIPVENPQGLIRLADDFSSISKHSIHGAAGPSPPQQSFPWCAINPITNWLYSSEFDGVSKVFAYDPAQAYRHVATLELSATTNGVQGGCFSPNGKLYLSSNASRDIRGFSSLTGAYLGSAGIQVDEGDQEVEGICHWNMKTNGTATQVHVILLDNDNANSDDMWLKHYAAPEPGTV